MTPFAQAPHCAGLSPRGPPGRAGAPAGARLVTAEKRKLYLYREGGGAAAPGAGRRDGGPPGRRRVGGGGVAFIRLGPTIRA
jgi:hypothetical protein